MSINNSGDVGEFHQKFGLDNTVYNRPGPRPKLPPDLVRFRLRFILEEFKELLEACDASLMIHEDIHNADVVRFSNDDIDIEQAADALADLAYVVHGFAHLLGLPWHEIWNEVQRSNMAKERAQRAADSKRGSTWDVIKPPNWRPPDIKGILRRYGWSLPENSGV